MGQPAPAPKSTLEDRVTALEGLVNAIMNAPPPVDQSKWPRRCCDAPGCEAIIRKQNIADLGKFCPEHNVP